ncbi:hypothetical protein [Sphingobacterium psychroaquaticum]|uniref:Uncharacterized protein n=1 Tax=Sphingobacterium psychroaquaticum TaxID=561061 RepID=A0A1X7JVU1_9SPHI|nr:hypothetical protein [Sphingobacterium psychroaquaticum]SMG32484.1 hypothetical protein SAMN05660862_2254 [Sphingobacterium psychroaquaticum]
MSKIITATHPSNEVTGLAQRKKLINVGFNPETGYLGLTFSVESLDPKGNPIREIQGKQDTINFHEQPLSTPTGTYSTVMPDDVKAIFDELVEKIEPIFIAYGNEGEEVQDEA